jgi:hypothetical protein
MSKNTTIPGAEPEPTDAYLKLPDYAIMWDPFIDKERNTKKQELSPFVAALMAFTLAVMVGQGAKVHRDISPEAYWINIGWQVLGCASVIVLGILGIIRLLRETFLKCRKRKGSGPE